MKSNYFGRKRRFISSNSENFGFHLRLVFYRGVNFIRTKRGFHLFLRGDFMKENKLADMSTEFAISVLKLTDTIKGHYALSNQLERSGTSIGANIREAKYAFLG